METKSNKGEMLDQLRIDRAARRQARLPRSWIIAGATLATAVLLGLAVFLTMRGEDAYAVSVAVARSVSATPNGATVLDASGYVVARRQATVSSKITGKVRDVLIEEGQRVEEGQVLARLDDTEAQAAARLQAAQLAQARVELVEIRALLANAQREYERQQGLAARKLTSASALDAAATQVEAYRARLASAESAVNVAAQALRVAEVQLENTIVRAPFPGVVTVKAAQPGEMISPVSAGGGFTRTGIGTIVDMDSLEVEVDVNESFINRVEPGQPVEAVLNAYPDWRIPGTVIAIIPTADRSKATVRVRIGLDVKDDRIVPEMGVRVAFLAQRSPAEPHTARRGVFVPAAAVIRADGRSTVFVAENGTADQRSVQLGATLGGQSEILSGVRDGERVVVSPPAGLKDGASIQVTANVEKD